MAKISKTAKKFLKRNRKKSLSLPQDKGLHTFLNLGGRVEAKKDFFSVLKRAVGL